MKKKKVSKSNLSREPMVDSVPLDESGPNVTGPTLQGPELALSPNQVEQNEDLDSGENATAADPKEPRIWLMALTGPEAGCQHFLDDAVVRIGRGPENQIVPSGARAKTVSSLHLKLSREGSSFRLEDLDSTNGTYVNENRISSTILEHGAVIMLGPEGPKYRFVIEEFESSGDQSPQHTTLVVADRRALLKEKEERLKMHRRDEAALKEAVKRAREARTLGEGGETVAIMRSVLQEAVVRSRRKLKLLVVALLIALVVLGSYSFQRINKLSQNKLDLDQRILSIEERMSRSDDPVELQKLVLVLEGYKTRADEIQRNMLYKLGVSDPKEDFIKSEIKAVMKEFGAPDYSIPPEFLQQVSNNIRKYQAENRANIQRALVDSYEDMELIRKKLKQQHLPQDLAFMVLVESGFEYGVKSDAGAAGPWQFLPETAKEYNLKVTPQEDERYDVAKSTDAAGRYLRDLIREFGSGDGVMLALAAYNLGRTKVKRIIRNVEDPIRQRDFWYLYRVKALPRETRDYVPKIIAAIIIGRHPEEFDFIRAKDSTI